MFVIKEHGKPLPLWAKSLLYGVGLYWAQMILAVTATAFITPDQYVIYLGWGWWWGFSYVALRVERRALLKRGAL